MRPYPRDKACAVCLYFSLDAVGLPSAPTIGARNLLYVCSTAFRMGSLLRSTTAVMKGGEARGVGGWKREGQSNQKASVRTFSVILRAPQLTSPSYMTNHPKHYHLYGVA